MLILKNKLIKSFQYKKKFIIPKALSRHFTCIPAEIDDFYDSSYGKFAHEITINQCNNLHEIVNQIKIYDERSIGQGVLLFIIIISIFISLFNNGK
jgi:hypothetical protein